MGTSVLPIRLFKSNDFMSKNKWKIIIIIVIAIAMILLLPIIIIGKPWGYNGFYERSDHVEGIVVLLDIHDYELSVDGSVDGDLTFIDYTNPKDKISSSGSGFVRDGGLYFGAQGEIKSEINKGKMTLFYGKLTNTKRYLTLFRYITIHSYI